MRKSIIGMMIATMLFASTPFAKAQGITEYGAIRAFVATLVCMGLESSALTKDQKEHLIQKIEVWKNLPPTKENVAYVEKNSAQIKKLLATANDPKSQAALQKYMASDSVRSKTPTNSAKGGPIKTPTQTMRGTTVPASSLGSAPSVTQR